MWKKLTTQIYGAFFSSSWLLIDQQCLLVTCWNVLKSCSKPINVSKIKYAWILNFPWSWMLPINFLATFSQKTVHFSAQNNIFFCTALHFITLHTALYWIAVQCNAVYCIVLQCIECRAIFHFYMYYYSLKIFPHFWLVKSTCIIYRITSCCWPNY